MILSRAMKKKKSFVSDIFADNQNTSVIFVETVF